MAAPKGNNYGKFALNSGAPRKYTAAQLEAKAQEYFDWCAENPCYKIEMLKKSVWETDLFTGEQVLIHYVHVPVANTPLISGLCLYLGVNKDYLSDTLDRLHLLPDEQAEEFARVIRAIHYVIASTQIQGGLNGTLNANLVARLQGLAEKREMEAKNVNTNDDIDYDLLDDETLEKIAKAKRKK